MQLMVELANTKHGNIKATNSRTVPNSEHPLRIQINQEWQRFLTDRGKSHQVRQRTDRRTSGKAKYENGME
jgi:hypothetical protein